MFRVTGATAWFTFLLAARNRLVRFTNGAAGAAGLQLR